MDAVLDSGLTPWEQRTRIGVLRGLLETVKGAAFSPRTFFDAIRPEAPWRDAFWYGWLVQALFGLLAALLYLVPLLSLYGGGVPAPAELAGHLVMPLWPVLLYPAIVLALAAVVHALARLTRDAHHSFGTTLRAVCYSCVALGLLINGGLLLGVWALAIGVYALARLQQMPVSRAALVLVGGEILLGAAAFVPLAIHLGRHLR